MHDEKTRCYVVSIDGQGVYYISIKKITIAITSAHGGKLDCEIVYLQMLLLFLTNLAIVNLF